MARCLCRRVGRSRRRAGRPPAKIRRSANRKPRRRAHIFRTGDEAHGDEADKDGGAQGVAIEIDHARRGHAAAKRGDFFHSAAAVQAPQGASHGVLDAIAEPVFEDGGRSVAEAGDPIDPGQSLGARGEAEFAQRQERGEDADCEEKNPKASRQMRRPEPNSAPGEADEGADHHEGRRQNPPSPLEQEDGIGFGDEPMQAPNRGAVGRARRSGGIGVARGSLQL